MSFVEEVKAKPKFNSAKLWKAVGIILVLAVFLFPYGLVVYFFASCSIQFKQYESGFYVYEISKTDDGNRVRIMGLTQSGKQQEYIIIPDEIDGMKVISLGAQSMWGGGAGYFESDKLKKIFVPHNIGVIDRYFFRNLSIIEKIIFMYPKQLSLKTEYQPSILYTETSHGNFANVSYYINYVGGGHYAERLYFIDDYDYGGKITIIPPPPVRDGFMFAGWYKEYDCINAWNFNTDTLPPVQYKEDGETVQYQETKLYAQWVEK